MLTHSKHQSTVCLRPVSSATLASHYMGALVVCAFKCGISNALDGTDEHLSDNVSEESEDELTGSVALIQKYY